MFEFFHGVDRHTAFLTITIVNREGTVVKKIPICRDMDAYIRTLSGKDAVVLEAGNNAFHLADCIERQGACPFIIDPRQFKLITQSTKKTDKNDSEILAHALRQSLVIDTAIRLPLVYKPSVQIRELRRLFSSLRIINKSLVVAKNAVIGMLRDCGIDISVEEKRLLFREQVETDAVDGYAISIALRSAIEPLLQVVATCLRQKKEIQKNIIHCGRFFQSEVELLISIKGVSPLFALAFLADIADIHRFSSVRKLNGYLGLVPITRASGGKEYQGHIIRQSRNLTRTMFTQGLQHIGRSSPALEKWYMELRIRRGIGKARIALIRQIVKIMRRMLIDKTVYRWVDQDLYQTKLHNYKRILKQKEENDRKVA
jgi:transposase